MIKKILFLGYTSEQTKLIKFLKKKKYNVVEHEQKKLKLGYVENFDLILSFGYKKIIKKNILTKLSRPIINLHISFLPFNRGAHPNFWSFFDNTPKGVSIHEINEGIDTGKILYRKKINFILHKKLTFYTTYKKLLFEVERLFIKNYKKILDKKYNYIKVKKIGTFHKRNDLPKNLLSWKTSIKDYLKN